MICNSRCFFISFPTYDRYNSYPKSDISYPKSDIDGAKFFPGITNIEQK